MNKMIAHELTIKCAELIEGYFNKIDLGCSTCKTGCCHNCARYKGHNKSTELKEQAMSNPLFNDTKGFLGDTGCKLPRHQRSALCNSYICAPKDKLKRSTEYRLVNYLSECIENLNLYIITSEIENDPTDIINLIYKHGLYVEYSMIWFSDNILLYNGEITGDLKGTLKAYNKSNIEFYENTITKHKKSIKTHINAIENKKKSLALTKEKLAELRSFDVNEKVKSIIDGSLIT